MFTHPVRARRALLALALTPALGACAAFGYPSPILPPAPSRSAAVTNPVPAASTYEVFGVRYATLPSSAGYVERGEASWYGEDFDGRPTASGETYDMHDLTAAHRSLPLPTCARVTRLDTGRSVVVRVNDRGPFASTDRRIIDLSWAAARELEMVGLGTAAVEVAALPDEDGC